MRKHGRKAASGTAGRAQLTGIPVVMIATGEQSEAQKEIYETTGTLGPRRMIAVHRRAAVIGKGMTAIAAITERPKGPANVLDP